MKPISISILGLLLTLPACETLRDPGVQARALQLGFDAIHLAAEIQAAQESQDPAQAEHQPSGRK